jgi:serine/threonine protein kinase
VARFIRNYEIVHKLGGGKFGEVFLAAGETPGRGLSAGRRRVVAVKKLRDSSSSGAVQLLMQEFALLDQVKHRSIVRVFEYIQEENAVVMEAVDGVTLRQVLDECDKAHEQVFTEAVIEIACEIADALYQAYTTPGDNGEPLRLVHRDLKPENVMLTPTGEVKILDFGLARVDNADFQREDPNRLRGTPLYMAPEQAQMREVDHRTDLFALGLITYELLMGRAAYRVPENSPDPVGEVYDAIERAALQDCIAELESKIPGMGPIIARCLQARPQSRYQNGQELLVDLRRQLYRDRGAYLEEFCEFFFGSIYDHDPLPTLDSIVSSGPAPGGRRKRMSIEERLKQSMEREHAAAHEVPRRGAPVAPAPAAPSPPRGGSPQRAKPFSPPSGARPPIRPAPSAAPAPPPSPPAGGPPRPSQPRMVGARSPDETGMLELVPLSADGSGDPEIEDPSATAFFAIPAPRAQDKPAAAPAPAPSPPPSAPGPSVASPRPPAAPPLGGIQGPTSGAGVAPPAAPVGIQGPTAGGQVGTPFQASQPPPSGASAQQQKRVSSFRVYALLLAVFMLGCAAVVTAVWVGLSATRDKDPEPVTTVPAVADAPVKRPKARKEDTGDAPEPEPPPRRPQVQRPSNPKPAAPAPAPKPAANPGVLTVKMTDQTFLTTLEVTCPSGFRQRTSISPGGSASIGNVPNETCVLHFKGGAPARFSPVSGGKSLSCYIQGTTAVCQ